MITITVRRGDRKVGLSAVNLRAVNENGEVHEARTEFDGSALFDAIRPGTYSVEIEESQARRLNMRLAEPVSFTIGPQGGPAPDIQATVVFE
jgi:hypothetical protein